MSEFPWLTSIILLPLAAAMAIPVIPDKDGKTARWFALGVAMADFALMICAFWQNYDFHVTNYNVTHILSWATYVLPALNYYIFILYVYSKSARKSVLV